MNDKDVTFKELIVAAASDGYSPPMAALGEVLYEEMMLKQAKMLEAGVPLGVVLLATVVAYYAAITPTLQMMFRVSGFTDDDINSITNSMSVHLANDMKEWVINGKK